MEKKAFLILVLLGFALQLCSATLYTVGDSSGWDISTDLDSWQESKTFLVGDVLLFQYSSYHSVSEVTEPNYMACNATDVLQTSSNGNTSFTLTNPGDRYFICGNRLHCLGGMKLHVHVVNKEDQIASSPAYAPEAESGGSLPPGSTKSNTPLSNSAMSIMFNPVGIDFVTLTLLFGLFSSFFNVAVF
ncbi:OLC1v1033042C1 [Oldenlandia corymbosa var. corymbosa]|uniref:OLC1v1033042C1 n=1 Tax=Oldenlandia corymbosa var. corymbosa TaxID=529605 RepID=A0AAV1CMI6_OLDCO|nr:OLC1v1033042C1 [Oldenlandia corymbosa var. corymbosa]